MVAHLFSLNSPCAFFLSLSLSLSSAARLSVPFSLSSPLSFFSLSLSLSRVGHGASRLFGGHLPLGTAHNTPSSSPFLSLFLPFVSSFPCPCRSRSRSFVLSFFLFAFSPSLSLHHHPRDAMVTCANRVYLIISFHRVPHRGIGTPGTAHRSHRPGLPFDRGIKCLDA